MEDIGKAMRTVSFSCFSRGAVTEGIIAKQLGSGRSPYVQNMMLTRLCALCDCSSFDISVRVGGVTHSPGVRTLSGGYLRQAMTATYSPTTEEQAATQLSRAS